MLFFLLKNIFSCTSCQRLNTHGIWRYCPSKVQYLGIGKWYLIDVKIQDISLHKRQVERMVREVMRLRSRIKTPPNKEIHSFLSDQLPS